MVRILIAGAVSCTLAACQSTPPVGARGEEAYRSFPAPAGGEVLVDYTIGPFDIINITTYQEEGLSFKELKVDSSGNIPFPLIGRIQAAGKTADQLSNEIAARLGQKYLVDPQVTVVVDTSASRRVTVEGEVRNAGVFSIEGGSTLLQALALAKGPTDIASMDDVMIFRTINGQRMAGVFNLNEIRRGAAQDPEILANDTVVVSSSNGRRLYRDILQASPLIAGIFRPIVDNN